eukprot:242666_1
MDNTSCTSLQPQHDTHNDQKTQHEETKNDEHISHRDYTNFLDTVAQAIHELFGNYPFGVLVRNIIEDEYEDVNQVLQELMDDECMIMQTISDSLQKNDYIKNNINWVENIYSTKIHELLLLIFNKKITNIDILTQSVSLLPITLQECSLHHMLNIVVDRVKEINATAIVPIELNSVMQLFKEHNIDGKIFNKFSQKEFVTQARKFQISPKKAAKLFKAILSHFDKPNPENDIHINVSKMFPKQQQKNIISINKIDKDNINTNATLNKWWITFKMQIKHNVSFDHTTFREMVQTIKDQPSLAVKLKFLNYKVPLNEKNYRLILSSFIGFTLTLICERLICNGEMKLNCHCNSEEFQLFTYHFMIELIRFSLKKDNQLLNILTDITNTISTITDHLCEILPAKLQRENNLYFPVFRQYVIQWLQYEFYNFECCE